MSEKEPESLLKTAFDFNTESKDSLENTKMWRRRISVNNSLILEDKRTQQSFPGVVLKQDQQEYIKPAALPRNTVHERHI